MTNETKIRGLHVCQPKNTPMVGQVKCFAIEQKQSASGNAWTKIRNEKPEQGGQWYTVMTVQKTNYTDQRGNISFTLELEPSEPPQQQYQPPQNAPQSNVSGPVARFDRPPVSQPQPTGTDSVDQHIMRSANLYIECFRTAATTVRDAAARLNIELTNEDFRQIATTFYIDAKNAGYINHMPDVEKGQKKAPF